MCARIAGNPPRRQNWTCPHCGRVLDRYLFGTVTAKSVTGADKDAFWAGYQACVSRWKEAGMLELGVYRPAPGHETAYCAGWQHAAQKIESQGERKRGRRRGLQLFGVGILFTALGGGWMASEGVESVPMVLLAIGGLNLLLGAYALLTGESDACPPELPGTTPAAAIPDEEPAAPLVIPGAPTGAPPIGTSAVLGLNVAVFLAMLVGGVGLLNPTSENLIRWGANFGPRTTAGEWWRLFTCTFLHVGVIHIAFNMMVLMQIGPLIERLFGRAGFAVIYVVAGLAGSLASLAWNPYAVSAGASGAIFGLYGALLGFLALQRRELPGALLRRLLNGALVFVGFNIVYGLSRPGTDIAAHAGGLAGGFLCGLALSMPLTAQNVLRRRARNALVAAAAAVALPVLAASMPRTVDVQAHLKQALSLEGKTEGNLSAAVNRLVTKQISAAEFNAELDRQVFGEWMSEHAVLAGLRRLPERQARIVSAVVRYMELRHDGWLARAAAVRDGRPEKMKEAVEKQMQASREMVELGRSLKGR